MEAKSADAGLCPYTQACFDTHLHLNDSRFDEDRDAVAVRMAETKTAGLCVGYDMPSSRAAIRLARRHNHLFAAVGVHPMAAETLDRDALKQLEQWLQDEPRVVAVGECGLDRLVPVSRGIQETAFCAQMEMAGRLGKPLILHVRKAHGRMLEILSAKAGRLPVCILHGCSASPESVKQYLALGTMISLGSPVTWDNAVKPRKVAANIPLERLLLETDSPFSPPQGMKGERNRPETVRTVCRAIAALRGLTEEEIARETWQNACRVLRLPDKFAKAPFGV